MPGKYRKRSRSTRYKKNPYRKSKLAFLKAYIPRGVFWTTFKFRGLYTVQCDPLAGNINFYLGATSVIGNGALTNLQAYYNDIKIVYVSFQIQLNQSMQNALQAEPLYAAVTHMPSAAIPAAQIKSRILSSRNYSTLSSMTGSSSSVKLRWLCDTSDPTENDFVPLNTPAIAVPVTGGLICHADLPQAMGGTVAAAVTATFYCILRGQGCVALV